MSKEIHRLDIVFKDPIATYKAGEVVSGFVQMDLTQELKIKALKVHFNGAARVHWDEKRAYTKGSAAKLSHGNVDSYLDETFAVVDKGTTLSPLTKYSWPFVLRLPLYLPSSFDGQWGRVQYVAKVVVERPWKQDIELAKTFIVLGVLDLNSEPDAKKSVENFVESNVATGCCRRGLVSGHLAVERRGYSIGQPVPFTATIDNQTTNNYTARIILTQQSTFRADKQVRKTSTTVRLLTRSDVRGGEKVTWHDELKGIPTVAPSRLGGGCRTIDVKYLLSLSLRPTGHGSEVEIPVELLIGTTPLRKAESSGQPSLTVRAAATRRRSASTPVPDEDGHGGDQTGSG